MDPIIAFRHCENCARGQTNMCRNCRICGVQRSAGHAEYPAAPRGNCWPCLMRRTMMPQPCCSYRPHGLAISVRPRQGRLGRGCADHRWQVYPFQHEGDRPHLPRGATSFIFATTAPSSAAVNSFRVTSMAIRSALPSAPENQNLNALGSPSEPEAIALGMIMVAAFYSTCPSHPGRRRPQCATQGCLSRDANCTRAWIIHANYQDLSQHGQITRPKR